MNDLLADVLAVRPAAARLTTGIVTHVPSEPSKNPITVNLDGNPVRVLRGAAYTTPDVGDVALIATTADGRMIALDELAKGKGHTPPDPPPPPPQTGVATFPATAAGAYRGGRWRTDRPEPIQGDWGGFGLNQGIWCYGTAPAGTLAGATITGAEIFIARRTAGWNAAQNIGLYAHDQISPPGGTPARLAGPHTIGSLPVGAQAWMPVPVDWGQKIAAGTWRGLGIYSGTADPYVVLASLSQHGQTGALRLHWKR